MASYDVASNIFQSLEACRVIARIFNPHYLSGMASYDADFRYLPGPVSWARGPSDVTHYVQPKLCCDSQERQGRVVHVDMC